MNYRPHRFLTRHRHYSKRRCWRAENWPARPWKGALTGSLYQRVLMPRVKSAIRTTVSLALLFSDACALGLFLLEPAVAQSSGNAVTYLDQGWSQTDREMWYQISQGSTVLDYDIFLNLEVAGSNELFRS